MAKKRSIKVRKKRDKEDAESELSDDEVPEKYIDEGWKHWLQNTYAKAWYGVGCAFIDVIVSLEVSRQVSGSLSTSLPILVFVLLVVIELYIYHRLWGGLKILFRR